MDKDIEVKPMQRSVQARSFDVLEDCSDEMERQVAKWGDQRHPDIGEATGTLEEAEANANETKQQVDELAAAGKSNWAMIALEEYSEALVEAKRGDNKALYTELIQTAAVILSWARDVASRA